MSDERPTPAAAARMPADLTGRDSGSHPGRADRRPRPGRRRDAPAAPACRGTPPPRGLRPTAPAPSGRFPCARSGRRPRPGRRRSPSVRGRRRRRRPSLPAPTPRACVARLTRRVALWGAGAGRRLPRLASVRAGCGSAVPPSPRPLRRVTRPGRPGLLAALRRRAALWGAGAHGEYLAWSAAPLPRSAARISLRAVDGPVVLRELPSTPTVQPAVPSPAAALVPGPASSPAGPVAPPAQIGHRPPAPPVAESEPAGPRVPVQSARTPQPTGWPHRPLRSSSRPARSFPTATGLARARGDPLPGRARGSPRPPPCRAPRAPG